MPPNWDRAFDGEATPGEVGIVRGEMRWNDGTMERWNDGTMERWNDGVFGLQYPIALAFLRYALCVLALLRLPTRVYSDSVLPLQILPQGRMTHLHVRLRALRHSQFHVMQR